MVMERTSTNLEDSGISLPMSWWEMTNKVGLPIFRDISALNWSPEKERWNMYDSIHCGIFECRTLVSHDSLRCHWSGKQKRLATPPSSGRVISVVAS